MTSLGLLRRSIGYYWRTNLAVVLGVAAATAVIAGALLVGDSVRDSLRQMSLDRLADVDAAWVGRRFVRQSLIQELEAELPSRRTLAPAIQMRASLTRDAGAGRRARAGNVSIYGVDASLWELLRADPIPLPTGGEIVLNRRVAEQLGAGVGDSVSVVIEIPPSIPRDALLGDRDQTVTELQLTVAAIAEDASTPGRFGLNPSQQLPLNAFVALDRLQEQLGLSEVPATRRNPIGRPARVNAFFVGAVESPSDGVAVSIDEAQSLTNDLARRVQPVDLGLKFSGPSMRGYFALESEQMILEHAVAEAAHEAAQAIGAKTSPVLVYLLNQLGRRPDDPDTQAGYSMYSVAAGIDFATEPPFGPFEYLAGGPPDNDAGHQFPVVINDWLAADLELDPASSDAIGLSFPVKFHVVGDRGELPEEERLFRVAGIARMDGVAADRGFTPQVEGVTDVESYSDWREPFPLDHDAITDRDDEYWKAHRATPKVFLRLADAQELWRSRYGELTSLRVAPPAKMDPATAMADFGRELLQRLDPEETGLIVQPVKQQGLQAAAGTTDFTGLFIGFSFFLIAAAMLLIGLLFRLGVERRVRELGLLGAVGLTPRSVQRLMFAEGLLLASLGAAIGIPVAIGYAGLMVYGLKTWWNKAIGTEFLFLSVRPGSVVAGAAAGLVVAGMAIAWSVWQLRRVTSRELLHGATESSARKTEASPGGTARRVSRGAWMIAGLSFLPLLLGLGPREAFGGISWQVVGFFVAGMALLTGGLARFAAWLAGDQTAAVQGRGTAALARLGLRNAARNRGRSLLTASLIASAAFVIVAVATGKRNPQAEAPVKHSGNGGYLLVAESSQPILYDLNTTAGRKNLRLTAETPADEALLAALRVAPFRMRPGEDASCLNLYRTELPTILGVPADVLETFDREGRFRFADTPGDHPWKELEVARDGDRIPVMGDVNTLMFSLKLGLGGTLAVPSAALTDSGRTQADLEVVGMLDGSVFQGVLLMSEQNFQRLFPNQAGFRYFLVESPDDAGAVSEFLESKLSDAGFDAEPVAARLADFLAVQNTYLSTFQTLGGLGLLLGTVGLATVMLRNVLERRSELALMRAVGLSPGSVLQLIWWENLFLLVVGLAAGTIAALVAMLPHLASRGADVPWLELAGLLGAVLLVGLVAPLLAGREAVRTTILAGLRSE